MFIRKKKNRSGNISVTIITKIDSIYRVVKSFGSSNTAQGVELLYQKARHHMESLSLQPALFISQEDALIESYLSSIKNGQVQVKGPELVFGKLYDHLGFGKIKEDLFRHLVIARLSYPGSKLKTIDYLYRYLSIEITVDAVYRFLDKLQSSLKEQVEQIAFSHTKSALRNNISVVFYDIEKKFNLSKPIVVADAGLLSNNNVALLEKQGYSYILGARIKNETTDIKQKIINAGLQDGQTRAIKKNEATRLIISYTNSRAAKDEHNRKRGLQRLEKQIKSGRLTKSSINNKGYNKYLKMVGELQIEIDYEKYQQDKQWDGLKGYLTNCRLKDSEIIDHYKQLWQIEKAFRISKTDLKIRPVYHRLRHRIEAHICIAFVAYSIYKELERILQKEKSHLSLKEAADLTHTIYQLNVILPQSKHEKSIILKMDGDQDHLTELINKNV